ncbi:MAG: GNAT family protein [Muribaculaceae bacterium]
MNLDNLILRKAESNDVPEIWDIIFCAKEDMRMLGRAQWQDGYPAINDINTDISKGNGFILCEKQNAKPIGYSAIILTGDDNYKTIDGEWITSDTPYVVIHRLAVYPHLKGQGIATHFICLIEQYASSISFNSLRIDTNFDNDGMLRIMEKLNYVPCGIVTLPTGLRQAYEKILI